MRRFRKLFLTLGIAPVLMGAALTAGAVLPSADSASAGTCSELAYGFYYNHYQGNSDYAAFLLGLWNDAGCGA